MHTMLHNGPRAAGILSCLLGLGLTGCFLPVPTVPLNLPAHGHTYKVRDRANLPAGGEGILIIRTYYPDYTSVDERLDCYPIRNGRAIVPFTLDMQVVCGGMFGYFSPCIPIYFLLFANADHAQVYPVMPGMAYWDEYGMPCIGSSRFIYGVEPRPQVLRMFPAHAQIERTILKDIEHEMQKYIRVAGPTGWGSPGEDSHNERQAKLIVEYVQARLEALGSDPASQPAYAKPPASQP